MGRIQPFFGNSLVIVELQVTGALPTTYTLWTGTTGNIIKFSDNVKGSSSAKREVAETEYKTNDDALYDTKEELKGILMCNHYDRSELPAKWLENSVPAAKAAGKRYLAICNVGYVSGKYKEFYQVGVVNQQAIEEDDKPDATFPIEHKSTPPDSALTLSTTVIAAINTAVGAGTVKASAAVVVPAKPTVRILVTT